MELFPNSSLQPGVVSQDEIFHELGPQGQQPIEVDPSPADSDSESDVFLYDFRKEGDVVTYHQDTIGDLVRELRNQENKPLPDEPHRIQNAIERVAERLHDDAMSLADISEEIKNKGPLSRAFFYFNYYFDLEVTDDKDGVTEEELINDFK